MEFPNGSTGDGFTLRFANPGDAKEFTDWALKNNKIPKKDILKTLSQNNPTTTVIVVEKDGTPVLFVPLYCAINIAYLGFNPESGRKDRLEAMQRMLWAVASFAYVHGIREVDVQSAKDYPVGRWALKNGFEEEPRDTFTLRVTPIVDPDNEAPAEEK